MKAQSEDLDARWMVPRGKAPRNFFFFFFLFLDNSVLFLEHVLIMPESQRLFFGWLLKGSAPLTKPILKWMWQGQDSLLLLWNAAAATCSWTQTWVDPGFSKRLIPALRGRRESAHERCCWGDCDTCWWWKRVKENSKFKSRSLVVREQPWRVSWNGSTAVRTNVSVSSRVSAAQVLVDPRSESIFDWICWMMLNRPVHGVLSYWAVTVFQRSSLFVCIKFLVLFIPSYSVVFFFYS